VCATRAFDGVSAGPSIIELNAFAVFADGRLDQCRERITKTS
jgi:hypothetical protein